MKKAAATRLNILHKAFELIYARGYQSTSIDDIIATTQVTKGAFYYHFKTKEEMGLAIINEILKPTLSTDFLKPLTDNKNPLDGIYNLMDYLLMKNELLKVEFGCPASNFAQEMTPWNNEFNIALNDLSDYWVKIMQDTLEEGKKNGLVKKEADVEQVSLFVISGYWGIRNFGKLKNTKEIYAPYLRELRNYLDTLK
jgi:AcrR family transcriptional regulator